MERFENNLLGSFVVLSIVNNLLGVSHQWVCLAQDLLALYFAVLENEVVGESRVPDVAETRRASIFEEANVGKFGHVISVDSEAVGKTA